MLATCPPPPPPRCARSLVKAKWLSDSTLCRLFVCHWAVGLLQVRKRGKVWFLYILQQEQTGVSTPRQNALNMSNIVQCRFVGLCYSFFRSGVVRERATCGSVVEGPYEEQAWLCKRRRARCRGGLPLQQPGDCVRHCQLWAALRAAAKTWPRKVSSEVDRAVCHTALDESEILNSRLFFWCLYKFASTAVWQYGGEKREKKREKKALIISKKSDSVCTSRLTR